MNSFLRCCATVALSAGCLLTTGCMTEPYSGQLQQNRSDTFKMLGWYPQPGKTVVLQCQNLNSGTWTTIGFAVSGNVPAHWDGQDWYVWSHPNVQIPHDNWATFGAGYVTKVRALVDGQPLGTFKTEFSQMFDPDGTLSEMWNQHGAGDDAILFALD